MFRLLTAILLLGFFTSESHGHGRECHADMVEAGADLRDCDFYKADLSGLDFSGSDLFWAELDGTNLSGANLTDANLDGVGFKGADISLADFSDAKKLTKKQILSACIRQDSNDTLLFPTLPNDLSSIQNKIPLCN